MSIIRIDIKMVLSSKNTYKLKTESFDEEGVQKLSNFDKGTSYNHSFRYSYITVGVGYLCYYTSPRRSRGRVLITKISYDYCDITGLFPT